MKSFKKFFFENVELDETEAAYKKADRDEKRKSSAGEYYVTNHENKKTHSEPFKTSDEAISHANAKEDKTGRIHTVHHIKNGKIQKQWQYSDSAGRFTSYNDHAGQKTNIHEEVDLDEAYDADAEYVRRAIPALRNAVEFHKDTMEIHDKKSTKGSPAYVKAHSAAASAHKEAAERHKIAHAQLSHGTKDVAYYINPARELGAYAEKLSDKANALKEEVEQIDEISKKLAKSYLDKSAAEREANPKYSTREKFRGRMIGGATADAKLKGRVQQPYKFGQAPKRKMYVKVGATNEEVDLDESTMDKNHPIVKEYQAMKKHDIKTLRGMIAVKSKIIDTSEFKTKDHAISSYLRSKHGDKNVDKAFGFNEEVELDENGIKGWKHAGSDISKMRAAAGKDVKLVRLKKDGTENKMHDATKMFRSEDEAQQHHDRVVGLNPKTKIAHNLYVDGKHVKTLGA